jgi:hypothetical protein
MEPGVSAFLVKVQTETKGTYAFSQQYIQSP